METKKRTFVSSGYKSSPKLAYKSILILTKDDQKQENQKELGKWRHHHLALGYFKVCWPYGPSQCGKRSRNTITYLDHEWLGENCRTYTWCESLKLPI